MDFSNPLFLISIVMGVTYVLFGWIMIKYPPKCPNYLYGYRTGRAMKNEENWDFAQRYSAKEMMKVGVVYLLLVATSPVIPTQSTIVIVPGMVLLFGFCFYPVYTTEKALKKFEAEKTL